MSRHLPFWKLDAAGNDFVLVRSQDVVLADGATLAREVCPRETGLGADGLVILDPETRRVVHHDPDGSRSFCLNALRAVACWLRAQGLAGASMTLETDAGPRPVQGDAVWTPPARPLGQLQVLGVEGAFLDVGNPQFVVELATRARFEAPQLMQQAAALRWHPQFSEGTNVTYALRDGASWRVRTYERGVEGETLSCGTGVVAAACALVQGDGARFLTRGGHTLEVRLEREGGRLSGVWSSGPARVLAAGRAAA